MPKAKNPMTEEERSRRFEEEVRKRREAGDFDLDAADAALERIVKKGASKTTSPPGMGRRSN
jgi:hypothetical protein